MPCKIHRTERLKLATQFILLMSVLAIGGCSKRPQEKPTPQMDAASQFLIRVLLSENISSCVLSSESKMVVKDSLSGDVLIRFDNAHLPINITLSTGQLIVAGTVTAQKQLSIFMDDPYIFSLDGAEYRGNLRLLLNPDGQTFSVVNDVPLEPYLAGVVGAEMHSYWEMSALCAQTLAARTYCLYIKNRFGVNRQWDVRKTQANQAYRGVRGESSQVWYAVNSTFGQVLKWGEDAQSEDIFPSYYSSICGGHTEDSRNTFGGDFYEPLKGAPCPYCRQVAKPNLFFWPVMEYDKAEVSAKLCEKYSRLNELGDIVSIDVERKSDYDDFSRLTFIKLTGSSGKSDFLRAEDLRLTLDPTGLKLQSTICKISDGGKKWVFSGGRGFGHGVGMCQFGAEAMARNGEGYLDILAYYYPHSKVVSIY